MPKRTDGGTYIWLEYAERTPNLSNRLKLDLFGYDKSDPEYGKWGHYILKGWYYREIESGATKD